MITNIMSIVFGFGVALVVGTLIEWVVHVLMHRRWFLGKVHTAHHKAGNGDGWLYEFLSYFAGAVSAGLAMWGIAWLSGFPLVGYGAISGAVVYAAFAAYAHQVQHDWPELVFWMSPPVHTVHHENQLWRTNFGISFDFWDRIFGTYQKLEWTPNPARKRRSVLDYFHIKWI